MALYSGDCNTMALIECDDDDSENGLMPLINRTGLTPGSTVFVRFISSSLYAMGFMPQRISRLQFASLLLVGQDPCDHHVEMHLIVPICTQTQKSVGMSDRK